MPIFLYIWIIEKQPEYLADERYDTSRNGRLTGIRLGYPGSRISSELWAVTECISFVNASLDAVDACNNHCTVIALRVQLFLGNQAATFQQYCIEAFVTAVILESWKPEPANLALLGLH